MRVRVRLRVQSLTTPLMVANARADVRIYADVRICAAEARAKIRNTCACLKFVGIDEKSC